MVSGIVRRLVNFFPFPLILSSWYCWTISVKLTISKSFQRVWHKVLISFLFSFGKLHSLCNISPISFPIDGWLKVDVVSCRLLSITFFNNDTPQCFFLYYTVLVSFTYVVFLLLMLCHSFTHIPIISVSLIFPSLQTSDSYQISIREKETWFQYFKNPTFTTWRNFHLFL